MQPVQAQEKRATGAKRGKTCNWCQTRENKQLVSSAGKNATGVKRGKNVRPVPSAGKKCNWCQARENMQLVPSAGKCN